MEDFTLAICNFALITFQTFRARNKFSRVISTNRFVNHLFWEVIWQERDLLGRLDTSAAGVDHLHLLYSYTRQSVKLYHARYAD